MLHINTTFAPLMQNDLTLELKGVFSHYVHGYFFCNQWVRMELFKYFFLKGKIWPVLWLFNVFYWLEWKKKVVPRHNQHRLGVPSLDMWRVHRQIFGLSLAANYFFLLSFISLSRLLCPPTWFSKPDPKLLFLFLFSPFAFGSILKKKSSN
jgi:hypothetical protein